MTYPACQQLQLRATGTDSLGSVDSATAGLFTGNGPTPVLAGLRALYHRARR
jgi:hypothetical protein